MMAFFDSLVQRELECLAEETDSLDGSSSGSARGHASDSSDSDQVVDFLTLAPKRGEASDKTMEVPHSFEGAAIISAKIC